MTVPSSFKVSLMEYHEFAQFDWDRCEIGEICLHSIDGEGRYRLSFLHRTGVFVVESSLWDGRVDVSRFKKACEALRKQTKGTRCLEGDEASFKITITPHDAIFKQAVQECSFMDGCFFNCDDGEIRLYTVDGDKAFRVCLESR